MPRIQNRRGLRANLPTSGMLPGELHYTTDQSTAHVATDATTLQPLVPAVDALVAAGAVDPLADLIMIYDADAVGIKVKRLTVAALKSSLNIPNGDADEKVAAVAGGTSGYLYGTDGTDGVLRMNASLVMTKDPSNGFVTLAVGTVDCGAF